MFMINFDKNIKYMFNNKMYHLNYIVEHEGFDIWLQNPMDDADTVDLFELPITDREAVEEIVLKDAGQ